MSENKENAEETSEGIVFVSNQVSGVVGLLIDRVSLSENDLEYFENIEELYSFVGEKVRLMICFIDDEGMKDDHFEIANYISCPRIFIFQNSNELSLSADLLSQNQIYGLTRGSSLKERLCQVLFYLGFLDQIDDYFCVEGIEIDTELNILVQVESISEDVIVLGKSGIDGIKLEERERIVLLMRHMNYVETLSSKDLSFIEEDLVVTCCTNDLIQRLHSIQYSAGEKLKVAFIGDVVPDFKYFRRFALSVVHYTSLDAFGGEENIVIVVDKIFMKNDTVGTRFCDIEAFKDKSVLLFERILPISKYSHRNLRSTTEKRNDQLLEQFVLDNRIQSSDDSFVFSKNDNQGAGIIRCACSILSVSESILKIRCPLKPSIGIRVCLPFLGESSFIVIAAEENKESFNVDLFIDSLDEIELNKLRVIVFKLSFLESKAIDLSQFGSLEEIEDYQYEDSDKSVE